MPEMAGMPATAGRPVISEIRRKNHEMIVQQQKKRGKKASLTLF
jgi:hypothetical protein